MNRATFNRVEKDVKVYIVKLILAMSLDFKVTLVGQLGLIGGTMGLFTGFSILSGIEIFYFTAKFFFERIEKTYK